MKVLTFREASLQSSVPALEILDNLFNVGGVYCEHMTINGLLLFTI